MDDSFSTPELVVITAVTVTFWFFVIRRWFMLRDKKLEQAPKA